MRSSLLEDNKKLKNLVPPKKRKNRLLSWLLSFLFAYLTIQYFFRVGLGDIWILLQVAFIKDETPVSFIEKFFSFVKNGERFLKVNNLWKKIESSPGGKFLVDNFLDKKGPFEFLFVVDKEQFSLFFSVFFFVLWIIVSIVFYFPVSWLVEKLSN
jgi:hypothetical protein